MEGYHGSDEFNEKKNEIDKNGEFDEISPKLKFDMTQPGRRLPRKRLLKMAKSMTRLEIGDRLVYICLKNCLFYSTNLPARWPILLESLLRKEIVCSILLGKNLCCVKNSKQ